MNKWNYYKQLLLLNLPIDITNIIFSFLKHDIEVIIANQKIYNFVNFSIIKNKNNPFLNNNITIHKNILPFKLNNNTFIEIIYNQIHLCHPNEKYILSHTCCSGKGFVFKHIPFNKKGNIITNYINYIK